MNVICFIRHVDSEKNERDVFDSESAEQNLTENGRREISLVCRSVRKLLGGDERPSLKVFSANSVRATLTARSLGYEFQCPITVIRELSSIGSGPTAGLTETEAYERYPKYMHSLELYRAGVISSGDIARPDGCERLSDFEERMANCLQYILKGVGECKVVVAHRSPITAMSIALARKYLGYPGGFFGYVPIPTGSATVFDFEQRTFLFVGHVASEDAGERN